MSEIEFQQFGSVLEQQGYAFVQHLEMTKITATITETCQKTDLQMFKSDKHGALRKMFTNTSSQSMEELCEE